MNLCLAHKIYKNGACAWKRSQNNQNYTEYESRPQEVNIKRTHIVRQFADYVDRHTRVIYLKYSICQATPQVARGYLVST